MSLLITLIMLSLLVPSPTAAHQWDPDPDPDHITQKEIHANPDPGHIQSIVNKFENEGNESEIEGNQIEIEGNEIEYEGNKVQIVGNQIENDGKSADLNFVNTDSDKVHAHVGQDKDAYRDQKFCDVSCSLAQPCEYPDEVDFRIIVLASPGSGSKNAPSDDSVHSVLETLDSLAKIYNMGWRVSVDVWMSHGLADDTREQTTMLGNTLSNMKETWKLGRLCVHRYDALSKIDYDGIRINAWRPKSNKAEEIALILDGGVEVSTRLFHWLLLAHEEYDARVDVSGYALRTYGLRFPGSLRRPVEGPATDSAFLYDFADWSLGFSPHPGNWIIFQDWYIEQKQGKRKMSDIARQQDIIRMNKNNNGTKLTSADLLHVEFSRQHGYFTVYCNLHVKYGYLMLAKEIEDNGDTGMEVEHLYHKERWNPEENHAVGLITRWQPEFGMFPENVKILCADETDNCLQGRYKRAKSDSHDKDPFH